jgi:hypothetical protein
MLGFFSKKTKLVDSYREEKHRKKDEKQNQTRKSSFQTWVAFLFVCSTQVKLLRALISLFRFRIYSCLSVSSAVTANEIVVLCDSVVGCT